MSIANLQCNGSDRNFFLKKKGPRRELEARKKKMNNWYIKLEVRERKRGRRKEKEEGG